MGFETKSTDGYIIRGRVYHLLRGYSSLNVGTEMNLSYL